MLTQKQLDFCNEYIKNGGNGKRAYLAAYDSHSEGAASVEACKLLADAAIQAQLAKLRKPIEKAVRRKVINEREYKKKLIQERIEECVARDDDAAIARYIEIWNKMDGEYLNTGNGDNDAENNIANLDTESLIRLVKAE